MDVINALELVSDRLATCADLSKRCFSLRRETTSETRNHINAYSLSTFGKCVHSRDYAIGVIKNCLLHFRAVECLCKIFASSLIYGVLITNCFQFCIREIIEIARNSGSFLNIFFTSKHLKYGIVNLTSLEFLDCLIVISQSNRFLLESVSIIYRSYIFVIDDFMCLLIFFHLGVNFLDLFLNLTSSLRFFSITLYNTRFLLFKFLQISSIFSHLCVVSFLTAIFIGLLILVHLLGSRLNVTLSLLNPHMFFAVLFNKLIFLCSKLINTVLIFLHFFVVDIFVCLDSESFFHRLSNIISEIIHLFLDVTDLLLKVTINVLESIFHMFLHLSLGISYEANLFTGILPKKSCILTIIFSLIDFALFIALEKCIEFVFCLL